MSFSRRPTLNRLKSEQSSSSTMSTRERSRLSFCDLERDLNKGERTLCEEHLAAILEGKSAASINDNIEHEYGQVVVYKNRPVARCRLLHFAVQRAAHAHGADEVIQAIACKHNRAYDIVRAVLVQRADIHAKAMYRTTRHETEFEAIHMAAGYGCVPAMCALLDYAVHECGHQAAGNGGYLQRRAIVDRDVAFYSPLHDATYQGHTNAVRWLLEHNVDAGEANKDGVTALHFVALIGGTRTLPSGHVEEMVTLLLEHRASPEQRSYGAVDPYPSDPFLQNKLPLDIASDTKFPQDLLHVLAPSVIAAERGCSDPTGLRFFTDLLLLSMRNASVATSFASQMKEVFCRDWDKRAMVMREAQVPGQVDRLASLIYRAPLAAGEVFDILTVEPEVQDVAKHPPPTRCNLKDVPMMCTYQTDKTSNLVEGVDYPVWKYDARHGLTEGWHKVFFNVHGNVRYDSVYNVDFKVVLLPNMLDVDILMALSRTWSTDRLIFSKMAVQGTIYHLWGNLVFPVFLLQWICYALEFVALVWWGLTPSGEQGKPGVESQWMYLNFYWAVLLGGVIRDVIHILWWWLAHWSKWHSHSDSTLKEMWDPRQLLTDAWFMGGVFLLGLRIMLLCTLADHDLGDIDRGMLAVNAFVQGVRLTYQLRLLQPFKRILTIFKTLFSRRIGEMLLIAVLFFLAFTISFALLCPSRKAAWVTMHSYRGLIFGDGDGLDNMGLKAEKDESEHPALTVFMIFGTLLVNILILNLIIAIYGNEYEEVNKNTDILFVRERCKFCLIHVEMLHKQRVLQMLRELEMHELSGSCGSRLKELAERAIDVLSSSCEHLSRLMPPSWRGQAAMATGLLAAASWLLPRLLAFPNLVALVIAFGQILVETVLMQAEWFQPEAPEICTGARVQLQRRGSLTNQVGTVMSQHDNLQHCASMPLLARKWVVAFDGKSPSGEEPWKVAVPAAELTLHQPSRFLWICHRSDYAESFFQDDEAAALDEVMCRLESSEERAEKLETRLRGVEDGVSRVHTSVEEVLKVLRAAGASDQEGQLVATD